MKKSERTVNRKDKADENRNTAHRKAAALIATTETTDISQEHDKNHTINEDTGLFLDVIVTHSSVQKALMTQGQSPSACKFYSMFNGLDKCCHFNSWPYIKRTSSSSPFESLCFL